MMVGMNTSESAVGRTKPPFAIFAVTITVTGFDRGDDHDDFLLSGQASTLCHHFGVL